MPIYEYRCARCGHSIEALQKIGAVPLTQCPSCGEEELKKMVSAPTFRLKGGGWYETDFKKDNRKRVVTQDSESNKSESKPEVSNKDGKADKSTPGQASGGKDATSSSAKPAGKGGD